MAQSQCSCEGFKYIKMVHFYSYIVVALKIIFDFICITCLLYSHYVHVLQGNYTPEQRQRATGLLPIDSCGPMVQH